MSNTGALQQQEEEREGEGEEEEDRGMEKEKEGEGEGASEEVLKRKDAKTETKQPQRRKQYHRGFEGKDEEGRERKARFEILSAKDSLRILRRKQPSSSSTAREEKLEQRREKKEEEKDTVIALSEQENPEEEAQDLQLQHCLKEEEEEKGSEKVHLNGSATTTITTTTTTTTTTATATTTTTATATATVHKRKRRRKRKDKKSSDKKEEEEKEKVEEEEGRSVVEDENGVTKTKEEHDETEEEDMGEEGGGGATVREVYEDEYFFMEEEQDSPTLPLQKRPSLLKEKEFNDNFTLDLILSLRTCLLGSVEHATKDPYSITEDDFDLSIVFKISRTGNQKRYTVKDYAPGVFYQLRRQLNISTESCLESWSSLELLKQKSSGKSLSLFMFSPDRKYIIKTISKEESKHLREIFPSYFAHTLENPNSLLMKFLGHHRLTRKGKDLYIVILANLFNTHLKIDEIYDLKGSIIGRGATEAEKRKENVILKDKDLLAKQRRFFLSKGDKRLFMNQLAIDCKWLENHKRMDYSLLVGVHKKVETENAATPSSSSREGSLRQVPSHVYFCEDSFTIKRRRSSSILSSSPNLRVSLKEIAEEKTKQEHRTGGNVNSECFTSAHQQNGEIYFVGIIDFLQKYNSKKKVAHIAKSLRHRSRKHELSTVDPSFYAKRFSEFVELAVTTKEEM